jgi:hypothetical protein
VRAWRAEEDDWLLGAQRPAGTKGQSSNGSGRVLRRIVLCSPGDATATWLAAELGFATVTIDSLVYSPRIVHRVCDGVPTTSISLHDGRLIDADLEMLLNRVQELPTGHLDRLCASDRNYANQELHAIFASILYGLPGKVLNRGSVNGLSGPLLSKDRWRHLAARCGLSVEPRRGHAPTGELSDWSSYRRLTLVGAEVVVEPNESSRFEPLDDRTQAAVVQLGEVSRCDLLHVELVAMRSGWSFVGATSNADLRSFGQPLADAVRRWFA